MGPKIAKHQIWKHIKKGTYYQIIDIANEGNPYDDDNNPPIVVYREVVWHPEERLLGFNGIPGTVYARKEESWNSSFDLILDN